MTKELDSKELEVKFLDFGHLFNSFKPNEELTITQVDKNGNISQKLANISKINDDRTNIHVKIVETSEELIWEKERFIKNEYQILDIYRHDEYDDDVAHRFQVDNFSSQLVNKETIYIEKETYEQIYPIDDQVNEIYKYLVTDLKNTTNSALVASRNRAEAFGDLIERHDNYDFSKKHLEPYILDEINQNPLLNYSKYNSFHSQLLRPIVSDSKRVFTKFGKKNPQLYFDEADPRIIDVDAVNDLSGADITHYVHYQSELNKQYEKTSKDRSDENRLTYIKARIMEYDGGELPEAMEDLDDQREIEDIANNFKPISSDVSQYSVATDHGLSVVRDINPSYPFRVSEKKSIKYHERYAHGPLFFISDDPDKVLITEKAGAQVCRGTAKTAESKYYNPNDKDIIPSKKFIQSISKEPYESIYHPGEKLNVIGMYWKNPKGTYFDPNYVRKIKINDDKYVIQNDYGHVSLSDRIKESTKICKVPETDVVDDFDLEKVNYNKNTFIYFGKEKKDLTKEEYNQCLEKIIPSIEKIIELEKENIQKVTNIKDLNRILSRYLISDKNINNANFNMITSWIQNNIYDVRQSVLIERKLKEYYKKVNDILDKNLQKIFDFFVLNNEEYMVYGYIEKLFHSIGIDEISSKYLLSKYFDIEIYGNQDFVNSGKSIKNFAILKLSEYFGGFTKDVTLTKLLIQPLTKSDHKMQKIVAFAQEYYELTNLKFGLTNLSVINKIFYKMKLKDGQELYSWIYQYFYAINGLKKDSKNSLFLSLLGNVSKKIHARMTQFYKLKTQKFREKVLKPAYEKPVKKSMVQKYQDKFCEIKANPDIDERYYQIEQFIFKYGYLDKKLSGDTFITVPEKEALTIFYNVPGEVTELCCKHYLLLVQQAWKDNKKRRELQLTLERLWGVQYAEYDRYYYCKNCREVIGMPEDSDQEGFDDEGGRVQFRDALQDLDIIFEDELSNLFKGLEHELYLILSAFIKILNIEIDDQAIIKIVRESASQYNQNFESASEFEHRFMKQGAQYESENLLVGFKYGEYENLRREIFPNKTTIDIDEAKNTDKKSRFRRRFDKIMEIYNVLVANNKIISVMSRFAVELIVSDPEIKIGGAGERFSKLGIFNKFISNPDKTLEMINNFLVEFGKPAKDGIWKSFRNYYFNFKHKDKLFENLKEAYKTHSKNPVLKKRYENKLQKFEIEFEIFSKEKMTSSEWNEFKPSLEISNNEDELDFAVIEQEIRALKPDDVKGFKKYSFILGNYLFYKIHSHIASSAAEHKGAFANYCCLSATRSKYIDVFIQENEDLVKCLGLIDLIDQNVQQDISVNLFTIYGEDLLVRPQPLLEYFDTHIGKFNLMEKAFLLFNKYRFFNPELAHLIDEKEETTRVEQEIRGEIDPQFLEIYGKIVEKMNSLSSTASPDHLIKMLNEMKKKKFEDKKYPDLVELAKSYREYVDGKDESVLHDICLTISTKINGSSLVKFDTLYSNVNGYESVSLETLQRFDYLGQIKGVLKRIMECDSYSEENYPGLSSLYKNYDRLDSVGEIDKRTLDQVWNEFQVKYGEDLDELKQLGIGWTESISNFDKITHEIKESMQKQLHIEGYETSEINGVIGNRLKHVEHQKSNYKTESLKAQYQYLSEAIYKFKYHISKWNKVITHKSSKIVSDEQNKKSRLDNLLKNYMMVNFFQTDDYRGIEYEQIPDVIPVGLVNDLQSSPFIPSEYLNILVTYFIQRLLILFLGVDGICSTYISEFVTPELMATNSLNVLTEKQVSEHLRNLLSELNKQRKETHAAMSASDQDMYKLMRELGLGNYKSMAPEQEAEENVYVLENTVEAPADEDERIDNEETQMPEDEEYVD